MRTLEVERMLERVELRQRLVGSGMSNRSSWYGARTTCTVRVIYTLRLVGPGLGVAIAAHMARTFLGQIYALVPIGIVGARLGFGAPRSRSRRDLGEISARSREISADLGRFFAAQSS